MNYDVTTRVDWGDISKRPKIGVSRSMATNHKPALGEGGRHGYTDIEKRLFRFLSETKKITSITLAEKHFGAGDLPLYGRNNVVSRMRLLRDKIAENKEPFRIAISKRSGPKPQEFWIERA